MPELDKPLLTNFNPNEFKVVDKPKKEVIKEFNPNEFKVVSSSNTIPHINDFNPKSSENTDNIIDNITDISDDKKSLLKDVVKKGVKTEEISESILTLQGKHPKQNGSSNYYINDNGIPVPLASNEKPPANHDVASIWGTQKSADDDNLVTSTGKHLWNGIVDAVEGQISLAEVQNPGIGIVYDQLGMKDANPVQYAKNKLKGLKFSTPSYEKDQLLNTEGFKKWEDILDPDRWNPTTGNVQGQILNGLESVVSFAIGRGGGLAKGGTKALQKGLSAMSAYNMSLTPLLDVADEAGLSTKDKYAFATIAAIPQAMLESAFGTEGLITKNAAARSELINLAKIAASKIEKDEVGNITKAGLEQLQKEMSVAATSVISKYAKNTTKSVAEEAGTEVAQQFAEESSKQLYDKLSQDPKFNADAFSPESLGKYVNSAIGGALGSVGPSVVLNKQKSNIEKEKLQSENVYETIKKGENAVSALKQNVKEGVKNGSLTPEEADNANIRINSYEQYNKEISSLNLNDTEKKEAFELTFQKENLKNQMENFGDVTKLSPIQQGLYNGLEKQAKDLQSDINNIILKGQIKKPETTVVGKKTIEDEIKKDNPVEKKEGDGVKKPYINPILQKLAERHPVKEEKRSFEEIPVAEYNKEDFNSRVKHEKLTEYLENVPDKRIEGKLYEKEYTHAGKKNSTFFVELPDGKQIKLASSVNRPEKFRGHMRTEHFIDKNELKGFPIGVKVEYLPEGKKVIKLYNGKTGKFISWAKETNRGLQKPSDAQIEQLEFLQTQIEEPFSKVINTPTKPLSVSSVQSKLSLTGTATPTKEEFVSAQVNNLLTAEDADVDQDLIDNGTYKRYFENQYNKTYGKTTTPQITEQTELAEGNNNESNTETTSEADRTETTLKKERSKDLKIKDPSRIKALKLDVFTPYEKVMQYFIGGGTLNSRSFRSLYQTAAEMAANKPIGEIKGRTNYVTPSSKVTIDSLAHDIWEQNPDLKFDVTDYKNAVEEVLNNEPASVIEMAERLLAKNNITNTPQEQELVDVSKQAEANDLLDEFNTGVEALEQYTDDSLNSMADDTIELPEDIIRNEGMEDQFQKIASIYGDVQKVVKHIQSVLPKIKVKYDENLGAAGKLSADGKTISINPYYAGIDTPIHEAGHVLIDAMGYNDPTIQKAIKQLEKSKLWKEIKARYPELNTEMLGKEVLAEAIGREGAGIFEKESNISKFQKLLDRIFQWFKDNLGLERNEAKALAKQILRGEVSDLAGTNTGKEQFQKESSLADDLREVNDYLKQDLSAEEREQAEEIKSNILEAISDSPEIEQINDVLDAESLEEFTLDELIEVYNNALELGDYKNDRIKDLKLRIAYYLNERGKEVLRTNKAFKEEESNKKDLNAKDVRLKVLSHMDQNFPELQQLSPIFDKAILDRETEAKKMKAELEKKAKAVIKEHNKKLGLPEKALQFFSSDNARYFEYMDDNGKFRTNTNGLSKAQIDLLDYMKELTKDRAQQFDEDGNLIENEVLKTDKGFSEMMRSEGVLAATKDYFKLPAQKYAFDYTGRLTNKFDKPRAKDKGYSKDFYAAAQSYIDDIAHTKHMSKFVPIVNSLDYLYAKGYGEVLQKPAAREWLKDWAQMHIYQTDKVGYAPADAVMKFFRTLTSQVVMGFNAPAAVMNIFMGNYNNWRKEGVNLSRKNGNLRLMGKGGFNKYGIDLLNKYDVVKADKDSNPTFGVGQYFQKLAFIAQTFGELQIQGSMFLGQLSDADYNSFEYNKDGELVVKEGVDEEALTKRMNEIKNRISDIQGKYGAKDRRNFMRSEFGKMVMQFRVWLPDAWKERFGKRYIDLNGNIKEGTFTSLTGEGLKELRQSIKDQGTFKALYNNKNVMANLRGAATIAFLLVLKYQDDEDDTKRKKALSLQNALNNVLFIMDTDMLKYSLKSPFAAFGTAEKFVETFDDVVKMDAKELKKDAPKIIPYSKAYTQIEDVVK